MAEQGTDGKKAAEDKCGNCRAWAAKRIDTYPAGTPATGPPGDCLQRGIPRFSESAGCNLLRERVGLERQ